MEDSCTKDIYRRDSRGLILIPARGGSKGIPKKNMYPLLGKPLIQYTIEAAIEADLKADIVVSTDDEEIKRFSMSFGIQVLDRPSEISKDRSKTIDAVMHAIQQLSAVDKTYHWIMLLQPTSPMRTAKQIREVLSLHYECGKSVISVTESEHHPFKMLYFIEDKYSPVSAWDDLEMPRQRLPKAIRLNGSIYCSGISQLIASGTVVQRDFVPYFMNWESSIDIDNMNSIQLAELILMNQLEVTQ